MLPPLRGHNKSDYDLMVLGHNISNVHDLYDSLLLEIDRSFNISLLESNKLDKNKYMNDPHYKELAKSLNKSYYAESTSIIIPLIINARARIFLLELIHNLESQGYTVYYCDTDSIVVDKLLPDNLVGNDIGQFKLEHTVSKGYFISGKLYKLFNTDGSIKTVNKGLSSKLSTMDFINLYKGIPVTNSSIRTLKSWEEGFVNINQVPITLTGNYDKRFKIYDDKSNWIDTKPINKYRNLLLYFIIF